jgi:hypothetical protein
VAHSRSLPLSWWPRIVRRANSPQVYIWPKLEPHHKLVHVIQLMHMPNLKHEFGVCPHILLQVIVYGIHKVVEFAPRNVVGIPWDEFRLDASLKEFPSVAMVLPLLLYHSPPPRGIITLQIGLGKLHGRMSSNLGSM